MIKIHVKNFGVMTLEMDYDNAKNTASNFVMLAQSGFYEDLTFHRIIKNFMIQGGDGEPRQKYLDYTIKGEFKSNGFNNNLKHTRGVISMARTFIPDSGTSQFFICHKDAPHLDGQYAAFGKVTEGMEAADKIVAVKRDFRDMPKEKQVIKTIKVVEE